VNVLDHSHNSRRPIYSLALALIIREISGVLKKRVGSGGFISQEKKKGVKSGLLVLGV
jgi:hypothetical protein